MNLHPHVAVTPRVPHRHPMLLLDRLEDLVPGDHARASKMITLNETWREGASVGQVDEFPPSLLIDALGQVAIATLSQDATGSQVWYLAAVEGLAIESYARAGDRVQMEAKVGRCWRGTSRVAVLARVEDRILISGTMVLAPGATQTVPASGAERLRREALSVRS